MHTNIHIPRLRQQLLAAQTIPISKELQTRLEWFEDFVEHGTVSTTCTHFTIARTTFYRWLERLEQETNVPTEVIEKPIQTKRVLEKRINQLSLISMLLLGLCLGLLLNGTPQSSEFVQASVQTTTNKAFPPCTNE